MKEYSGSDTNAKGQLIDDLKCFRKQQKIESNTIIGAVIGDVIGSVYEWNNIKST